MQPEVATESNYLRIYRFMQVDRGVEKTLQPEVATFADVRAGREKLRDVLDGKGKSEETKARGME